MSEIIQAKPAAWASMMVFGIPSYKDGNINYTQGEIKDLLPKNQELAEIVKLKTAFISAIEMVEKYVDNLNKTRYDVTNYIEIQKFLNGK